MDKIFKSHRELTDNDFKLLWEKGLFVFDTNVLLDLYRLPESAKKDLLSILSNKKISKRIWIPFQVALEFTNKRVEAISDQKNKFTAVKSILNDSKSDVGNIVSTLNKKLNDLQLKKRHSVINPDLYIDENLFKEALGKIDKFLKDLETLDEKQPDVNDKDELKDKISSIFEGKIGKCFNNEELDAIHKEGELRYKENIPPGYKDADKKGHHLFEDKKIIRKFGDLLVWKEIIKKAKEEKLEYVILVTGDIKEDWWQEVRGKKLGARRELLNEIYFEVSSMKVFNMYDTSSFMQNAKKNLKINVKDQSITETKDLLEFDKYVLDSYAKKYEIINVQERIELFCQNLGLNLFYGNDIEIMPKLLITNELLDTVLLEILLNVKNHSLDNTLEVGFTHTSDSLEVYFINSVRKEFPSELRVREQGIKLINQIMGKYGTVSFEFSDELFEITLRFLKKNTTFQVLNRIV